MNKGLSLLPALVLAGCSLYAQRNGPVAVQMYEGPERPLDQVAIIAPYTRSANATVVDGVFCYDGLIKQYGSIYTPRVKAIYVLPGTHLVNVKKQDAAQVGGYTGLQHVSYGAIEIKVELLAGHTYLPRAGEYINGRYAAVLEDQGVNFDQNCLTPQLTCLDK